MKTDVLIVGAGLSGSVMAERLASLGLRVLVIDKRSHIAGNVYDEPDEYGVFVQRYGPHLFHTRSGEVWDYIQRFSQWTDYEHRVRAQIDGQSIPLPFNLNSIERLFPRKTAERISESLIEHFGYGKRVPILELRKTKEAYLDMLAEVVYEKVFLNYTKKQWGLNPEELSPEVTGRVPVSVSRDDRYFQDAYQAMPKEGFAKIVSRMLGHPNIRILLQTSFDDIQNEVEYSQLIYTGPIDEYFKDEFGALPYRSLRFEYEHYGKQYYQEATVVNYPNERDFTRISEFKRMTAQDISSTTIIKEYPGAYRRGENLPYYPMMAESARKLYQRYFEKAKTLKNVLFLGRLAEYKYINMDAAIFNALNAFEKMREKWESMIKK